MCFLLGKTSCNVVSEVGITGKKKICAFSKYGSERSRSLTSNQQACGCLFLAKHLSEFLEERCSDLDVSRLYHLALCDASENHSKVLALSYLAFIMNSFSKGQHYSVLFNQNVSPLYWKPEQAQTGASVFIYGLKSKLQPSQSSL